MSFKKQYRDLEMQVHSSLKEKILTSNQESDHIDGVCLKIKTGEYTELTIINDSLTLLNHNGSHFSVFNLDLEELIDILEK